MAEIFPMNETVNGTYNLVLYGFDRCCPDIWTTLAPTLILLGLFVLLLYMAESRRDVGYAMFMLALSAFAFNDTILSGIQYAIVGQAANVPLLMVFISAYEVIMTLLLMSELKKRRENEEEQ